MRQWVSPPPSSMSPPSAPPSPLPPPPPSPALRPKCLGGIYLLDVTRAEALLSQLRKWCYFYQNVHNQTDITDGALVRSAGILRLIPGQSQQEWELSRLMQSFCEQSGAMPDNMNRGDGWAVEEECSSVLKVLGLRFGGNVCAGACAPWAQPCPSPPPLPPPPPLPCGLARGFGNGNEAPGNETSRFWNGNEAPGNGTSWSGDYNEAPGAPGGDQAPCPATDLNRRRPVEQESEELNTVAEPTGLQEPLADRPKTIELGSHVNGPPSVFRQR